MKTIRLSKTIAISLCLFISVFTLNSCSDDDVVEAIEEALACMNLTDCHAETVWKENGGLGDFYLKINNNDNNPFTMYQDDGSCFIMFGANEYGKFTVLINSSSLLKIRYDFDGDDEVLTFELNNNKLKVTIEYYEGSSIIETRTMNFIKSTMNVSSLNTCS